jgi:hypothetical protein
MSYIDYNIFYKSELPRLGAWSAQWDVFISAFNSTDRVRGVFNRVTASNKYWVIHNEYDYDQSELPSERKYESSAEEEGLFVKGLIDQIEAETGAGIDTMSVCVDITGFMRPHLIFLALFLSMKGVRKFDVLYSEPQRYSKKENTKFSDGAINVRQIDGFMGVNSTATNGDFLIIGSGYDDRLIKAVANEKDKADKVQIFGLPSLRADMYQENVLKAALAAEAIGYNKIFPHESFFAPANDPFVTATTLSEIVALRLAHGPIANLYLSPLATKPQALGFALFYIGECIGKNASILFPVSKRYSKETSTGIQRVWRYTLEFPIV